MEVRQSVLPALHGRGSSAPRAQPRAYGCCNVALGCADLLDISTAPARSCQPTAEVAGGERQLGCHAMAHNGGQALQRAHVGHNGQVCLLCVSQAFGDCGAKSDWGKGKHVRRQG